MSSTDNQYTNQAAALSDFALDELQLRQQPFTIEAVEAESGETFVDDIAEAQLDDIKQALISGDDLLLILGPEGSGKSTLLNQLGAKSGQRIQCFSVRGSDRFSTANLLSGMLEAFKKSPPDDLKLMLDELIPCLQGMSDHNTLGAVVLDDADLIPEAELTKLLSGMLYLNSSDEILLRVTLAAPTEFEERIPELLPEGADLPYSSLAIDAFDKDRSAAYLDYRLQRAGLTTDFPFNEDEIASINEEAGGRPGLLHKVAAQHLNARDGNSVKTLPPELEERNKKAVGGGLFAKIGGAKLLAGLAAFAMILAGLFWLKPNSNVVPDDRYKVVENKKLNTENGVQTQRLAEESRAEESRSEESRAEESRTEESRTEESRAEESRAEESRTAEQLAAEKLAAQNKATTLGSADTNNDTQANNNAQTNNGAQAEGSTQSSSTTDTAAIIAAKAEAAKAEAQRLAKIEREAEQRRVQLEREASQKAAAEKLAKEKLAAEQAEEVAVQEKIAAAAAASTANESTDGSTATSNENQAETTTESALNNLESANWILVQNPALFTVQMSASKERESVETFLSRTGLEPPNSIFSFNRNGATWYALVHGLYSNIEEARQDIERMPENMRKNQPWIRAVGRIQKAMRDQ